jgi:GH24 family phage-related lysozyme (muramidase)
MDIKKLQDEIEADEGFKLEIYLDHLNLPTLGIGHLIKEDDPEHGKPVGTKVSYERCSALFEKDIKITIDDCKKVYDDWDDMDEEV